MEAEAPSIAMTVARSGIKSATGSAIALRTEPGVTQINGRLRQVAGKAAGAIGAVEIPVDETNPAYPIYKSNSEFVLGNVDSAWSLYLAHADQLAAGDAHALGRIRLLVAAAQHRDERGPTRRRTWSRN